jgi:magnesium chelatase family protein
VTHSPRSGADTGRACGAVTIGATGYLAEAHAAITNGHAALHVSGMREACSPETRDRIRAALINSGMWPGRAITITLEPASLPSSSSALDLAAAAAVIVAAGAAPQSAAEHCLFAAEVGLDGSLRPVRGVLPAVLAAARAGCTRAVVAPSDAAEASMLPGITVISCQSLQAVRAWLHGEPHPGLHVQPPAAASPAPGPPPVNPLDHLRVHPSVRLALEVAAAGGHHLCLTGPAGAAIPALAEGTAGLLPPLSHDEAIEVAALHSAAGQPGPANPPVTHPPYRAPHHTVSLPALLGGSSHGIRPGETALAHRGVLFLDQAPEFSRDVLASLRQPLQHGEVRIARGGTTVSFPAQFILIAGLPPCPCRGRPGCSCTPAQARRYRGRLTSTLGPDLGLWIRILPPEPGDSGSSAATAASQHRVTAARDRARRRLHGTPWQVNASIPAAELRRSYLPTSGALRAIRRAVDLGQISGRAASHILRAAWTIADLNGVARPGALECTQALAYHLLDMPRPR